MLALARRTVFGLTLIAWLFCIDPCEGQPPKQKPEKVENYPIWKLDEGFHLRGAMTLLGEGTAAGLMGNLAAIPAARVALGEDEFLGEIGWRVVFDHVIPLPPRALKLIGDGRPLPDIYRKALGKDVKGPDLGWYKAYTDALNFTFITPAANFTRSAKRYDYVGYSHLNAKPWFYRGKIITVEGKLAVLRKVEAPRYATKGLDFIYTGWIQGPTDRAPPFTIVLTELPQGIEKPSEKLNVKVTFRGYFLSMVRFPADKRQGLPDKNDVISPYLVGKIFDVEPVKAFDGGRESPFSAGLIVTVLGAAAIFAAVIFALNVWFRRGDRRVQAQLDDVRSRHIPFNIEPAGETPTTEEKETH